ncbi:hypothetical protein ZWY2020_049014, partial [Hordeum vulgare]
LEVKPNQFIKVSPEDDHFLHLSQAALGEVKKDDKTTLFVRVDGGQKLAIGTLSIDKFPHIQFDLVFDKEFELSHNSKTTNVFFSGYNVFQPAREMNILFYTTHIHAFYESEYEQEPIIPPVAKENAKLKKKKKKQEENKEKKNNKEEEEEEGKEKEEEKKKKEEEKKKEKKEERRRRRRRRDNMKEEKKEEEEKEEEEETLDPESGKCVWKNEQLAIPITNITQAEHCVKMAKCRKLTLKAAAGSVLPPRSEGTFRCRDFGVGGLLHQHHRASNDS